MQTVSNELSSDTLAEACSRAEFSSEELRVVRQWIGDQLFAQEFAKLGQGGHKNTQIPLQDVFVDLPASRGEASRDRRFLFLRNFLLRGGVPLVEHRAGRATILGGKATVQSDENMPFVEQEGLEAVLLLGGPGQGKSTLGQLACQFHRSMLLAPARSSLTMPVRSLVDSVLSAEPWKEMSGIGQNKRIRVAFPLQISLPEFVEWFARRSIEGRTEMPELIAFLADAPGAKSIGFTSSMFLRLVTEIPVVVVLDGFDEVGSSDDRARIIQSANLLLSRLKEADYPCQILATTRPQGYSDEFSAVSVAFEKIHLSPLSKVEAIAYAEKIINAKMASADQREKALRQINEASLEPATERLLTTPLQVTIMTALVQQLGRAPRERWNLFDRYFSYTFDREIERNTYASQILADYRSHIERIHWRVGLLLQVESERNGGASARMSRERLSEVVAEVLREDEIDGGGEDGSGLIGDIVTSAENRLVFLVEPEPGRFGFEIRSLQEFMAAQALTSGRDEEVQARLEYVARAPKFRNVTLFIAGRLFSQGSALRDAFAQSICLDMDTDRRDPLLMVIRGGARLALETLEQGGVSAQPKRARALMSRALNILDLPLCQEQIRLIDVASDDTYELLINSLEQRLADPYSPRALDVAWICVMYANSQGMAWAPLLIDEYASKNPPTRDIVRGLNYLRLPLGSWLRSFISDNSERYPVERMLLGSGERDEGVDDFGWLDWLRRVFRRRRFGGTQKIYSVQFLREPHEEDVAEPLARFSGNSLWQAWIEVARFEMNPGAKTLGLALAAIDSIGDLEYWKRWALHRVSWPLKAVLEWARDTPDIQEAISLAERGALGDIEGWLIAQNGWKEVVPCRFVDFIGRDDLPWSNDVLGVSPPLFAMGYWLTIDMAAAPKAQPFGVMGLAAEKLRYARRDYERNYLATLCLTCWLGASVDDRSGWPVHDWIAQSEQSAMLLSDRPHSLDLDAWDKLLSYCSEKSLSFGGISSSIVFNSLTLIPDNKVLLALAGRSLLFMPAASELEGVDLAALRSELEKVRGRGGVSPSEVEYFIALEILTGALPDWLHVSAIGDAFVDASKRGNGGASILNALRWSPLPAKRIEMISAELCERASGSHMNSREVFDVGLSMFQRRFTNLDSVSAWDRLALPLPYPGEREEIKYDRRIPRSPVALRRIELRDVAGIRRLSLPLMKHDEDRGQWVVIVGPNGVGKTTILRSLALALRSVSNPAIWPRGVFSLSWKNLASDGSAAEIEVELADGSNYRTSVRSTDSLSILQSPPLDMPRLFPLFAYGCRRGSALGGAPRQVDLGEDDGPEIATLFDEGASLIQAETWLVALDGDVQKSSRSRNVFESLTAALRELLNVVSIEVIDQKVVVRQPEGVAVPLASMSDGYLTSMGWFLDLIARWLALADQANLAIDENFLEEMRGLVLIDEIDLHLHPQWQVDVIARTRKILPRMSFVVTTHNPLTLVGAKAEEIWMLGGSGGEVSAVNGVESPLVLSGGQLYRSYFGIKDIYPSHVGRMISRLGVLSGYSWRDGQEEAELISIVSDLAEKGIDLGWDVTSDSSGRGVNGGGAN